MNDIIELNDFGPKPSNFGSGIELLMNDRKSTPSASSDIDLGDLENLELELNELTDDAMGFNMNTSRNDLFGVGSGNGNESHNVRFDDSHETKFFSKVDSNGAAGLGQATASFATNLEDKQTWDGFAKFNNVPINPDKPVSSQPQLNKEEMLREKFKYLRKLETLESKGVSLTKKYSMEDSLLEMQGEYEMIMEEKSRQNSVKFQGNMLMAVINGIEFLNNRFDPFDVKLDGWSDQLNENLTDYDDVFAELYDKYKSRASMAPELKLLFQLGGSAMMVHMTNTMFKSAMPGMDDILRQNPDLMRQFQNAAVNSMGQTAPGFSGFMGGIMNPDGAGAGYGGNGPPPPMATQGPNAAPPSMSRGGNNPYSSSSSNRPDLSAGMGRSSFRENDGINIRENYAGASYSSSAGEKSVRQEMRGPSDINDILSGLKTKTININKEPTIQPSDNVIDFDIQDSSTISISDLKELQSNGSAGGNLPKRSKRRQKSDKNTVSLDI
jgi:hypothetical protein